eukprot:TRINITY_DN10279_c0_g1_i6.p1 TRINITY_DN10279_c0_g1~~TRINITY_DN10279_c0_g1_i6.p1  ORF type:complete len:485 (+),score=67.41 TRINITY_DN10279_c0_g1_i6:38-1456(+)
MQTNLLYSNVKDPESLKDASQASWKEFMMNPSDFMTRLEPIYNAKERVRVYYSIQNTPALDPQNEEQLAIFENYIRGNLARHYQLDKNVLLGKEQIKDERVDAVLYLLKPEVVKAADIEAMVRISRAGVAVLPVVAKADALQDDQRQAIRADLIEKAGLELFQFSRESLETVGTHQDLVPFFVILGNVVDVEKHDAWLVRKYRWGQCEAFRSRDSDLRYLKQLVFEVGFQELKEHTDQEYFKFCKTQFEESEDEGKEQPHVSTPPLHPVSHASTSTPSVETTSTSSQVNTATDEQAKQGVKNSQKGDKDVPELHANDKGEFHVDEHFVFTVKNVEETKQQGAYRLTLNVERTNNIEPMTLRIGRGEGIALKTYLCKGSESQKPQSETQRPVVYDVWRETLVNAGLKVERLVIKKFQGSIFYADLHISDKSGKIVQCVDARPSDAINISVRFDAPLYVAKSVMEKVAKVQDRV